MSEDVTTSELKLLRHCTANLRIRIDCDLALRGDGSALARCAAIIMRSRSGARRTELVAQ